MAFGLLRITRFHMTVFLTWQSCLFFGCQQLFAIFANYTPRWRCANETSFGRDCITMAACPSNELEYEDMAFQSMVMEFELICGRAAYIGPLISTLQFAGVLVGAIFYGHLADKCGRKPVALTCLAIGISLTMLSGASPVWQVVIVLRFFVGTYIGGTIVVMYTYTIELILPQQRVFLRVFFNWGWGRAVLTLVCLLTPDWRWASVATAGAALPAVFVIAFVLPESPTWLENKRHFDDMYRSQKTIAKIARLPPPPRNILHDWRRLSEIETKTYNVCDLFANDPIAKRTLILCLLWFTASICGYAVDLNSRTLIGHFYFNQILFSVIIIISKPLLFALDTWVPMFSRRMLHQAPQAAVSLCFTTIMLLLIFDGSPVLVLVVNLLGTVFIEYTWDACFLCGGEGFPTEVRAIGLGFCSLVARIGALLAPQLTFLGTLWIASPFLAVAVISTITLVLSFLFLPETKNVDLSVRNRRISLVPNASPEFQEMLPCKHEIKNEM